MGLQDCIKSAATELGLPDSDVKDIVDDLLAEQQRLRDTNTPVDKMDEALRLYARQKSGIAQNGAALVKARAAQNVVKAAAWHAAVAKMRADGVRMKTAITGMMSGNELGKENSRVSVESIRKSLDADYLGGLVKEATLDPEIKPVLDAVNWPVDKSKSLFDDITREMYKPDSTGNKTAAATAKLFARYADAQRMEHNAEGAAIGKLDGGWAPRFHNPEKVGRAGGKTWIGTEKSMNVWVDDQMQWIDPVRTFTGEKNGYIQSGVGSVAEQRDFLAAAWGDIVYGKHDAVDEGHGIPKTPSSVASSLEKSRVIHYKDADAEIANQEKYGDGNIMSAMFDHLESGNRKLALMKVMGTNPDAFLNARLAEGRQILKGERGHLARKEIPKLRMDGHGAIASQWAVTSGKADRTYSPNGAMWGARIRAWVGMTKLGNMLVSNLSDTGTVGLRLALHAGGGEVKGQIDALTQVLGGMGIEDRHEIATYMRVMPEALLGKVHERFNPGDTLPGWMAKMQSSFYTWTGMKFWEDWGRNGFTAVASSRMAYKADRHTWSELGEREPAYRAMLLSHGIDEARWPLVKQLVGSRPGSDSRLVFAEQARNVADEHIHPLVKDRLDAIDRGLGARVAKRIDADQRAAGWVSKRVDRLQEKYGNALDRLDTRVDALRENRVQARGKVDGTVGEIEGHLSELAQAATAHADVSQRNIGRIEGKLTERMKTLRASVRRILDDQSLKEGKVGEAFQPLFDRLGAKQDEITGAFERAKATGNNDDVWHALMGVEDFKDEFKAARDKLALRMQKVGDDADAKAAKVRGTIADNYGTLGDLKDAAKPFDGRRIGRDEGRLGERAKWLQRNLNAKDAESEKFIQGLGKDFADLWQRRHQEVTDFADRMVEHASERNAATMRDLGERPQMIGAMFDDARRQLELRMHGLFSDEASYAMLRGDDRTKMYMTGGFERGSLAGEAIRMIMHFKSFPIAHIQKVLRPAVGKVIGSRGRQGKAAIATLIAASTTYGMISNAMTDLLKNTTPRSPFTNDPKQDLKVIIAGMIRGGGGGIYGDVMLGETNRLGGGIAQALVGPELSQAAQGVELYQRLVHGDAKLGDAIRYGLSWFPYNNLHFFRAALDLAILNQLTEYASPGSMRRRSGDIKKQYGQGFLLNPTPIPWNKHSPAFSGRPAAPAAVR